MQRKVTEAQQGRGKPFGVEEEGMTARDSHKKTWARGSALWPVMICIVLAVMGSGVVYAQKTEPRKNVFNLYGRPVGSVDEEGTIYNFYGVVLGSVGKDGTIYNVSEINIGRMDPTGKVYNQSGTVLGTVATEGSVYSVSGTKIGSVLADENVILIGGAARLLLYRSR